jgi:hypothetical protein
LDGGGVDHGEEVGLLDEDLVDGPVGVAELLGQLPGDGVKGLPFFEVVFDELGVGGLFVG